MGPQVATGSSVDPSSQRDTQFSFKVVTPEIRLARHSEADDSLVVEIEGFETRERRPGAPDVPTKTVLVAIPPGAAPRLELKRAGIERVLADRLPRPVPRSELALSDDDARRLQGGVGEADRIEILSRAKRERFERDPAVYGATSRHPRKTAWLGRIGVLRDQRYVEVHLAPVSFDPTVRGLRALSEIEVVVHFEGTPTTGRTVRTDRFESVYRSAFVNYDQGRGFRLSAVEPATAVPAASASSRAVEGTDTPRYRIRVREHGIVRLDHTLLQGTELPSHDLALWRVTNRGVDVPLQINDDGDGLLEPGEWVQFYGQALDDEPYAVLNTDFDNTDVDLYEARDFTDENAYFLVIATEPQPPMTQRDATPTFASTPPLYFEGTAHAEFDELFKPLNDADPWVWLPSQFYPSTPDTSTRTVDLALPELHSGTLDARVLVNLRGLSENADVDPDHTTRVTLRNGSLTTLASDERQFDGRIDFLHDFDWTHAGGAELTDPVQVEIKAVPVAQGRNDIILDYVELRYPRDFTVLGDLLFFDWPDETIEFEIDGLIDTSPEIYEITALDGQPVIQPVRLTGASVTGADRVRFRIEQDPLLPDGNPRRFVVAGESAVAVLQGADFESAPVSDLRDNATQADIIVLAHPDLLNPNPSNPLSDLLAYRATPAGGGSTSKIVLLQEVADDFNHGLPGPLGIREFLRWVMSDAPGEGWADPKPTFVMLIGDGHFDYKGGEAVGNYIPTQMIFKNVIELGHYASDNLLAAVVGDDQLADLVVGRIPVRSQTDADLVLQKILDYEQAVPESPPEAWRRHALFITDRGGSPAAEGEALDFELTNAIGESYIEQPPYTSLQLRYWSDFYANPEVPLPKAQMHLAIVDAVKGVDGDSDGVAVLQYVGHGNFFVWSNDTFWDDRNWSDLDTDQLTNASALPWLLAHNCLTGGFHAAEKTIGQNWLQRDGGGAVAVWAPTGLSFNFVSRRVTEVVWDDLYGPRQERQIMVPVMNSLVRLCGQGSIEPCQQYVLLGDPATRLGLHSVEPPSNLQATAGNAVVQLTWSPSPTPGVTYNVHRGLSASSYLKANATPLTDTEFTDTTVSNAQRYYYYVVAVDDWDFKSRWTNFNSDCDSSGLDCVDATPLNPNPPSVPTGLTMTDPGTGSSLTLSWAPNPENDLSSYTIHFGNEPGVYTTTIPTGKATSRTLIGLAEGQMVYATVTATNTSGLASGMSSEASDFPAFGHGLRVPRFIDDLVLGKSGTDVTLEWTEIDADVYGKPKEVLRYEIYRGAEPAYSSAGMTKIGECLSPCSFPFLDPGAAVGVDELFYRVRAVDAEGNGGGMGSEAPRGTLLTLGRAGADPHVLALNWAPVTTAHDGTPVELSHYEIYAADQPFTREEVRDGSVSLLTSTSGTSVDVSSPTQDRYYSVVVVDIRGNVSPY